MCEINFIEKSNGIKIKTQGNGCKKLMGKGYFKEMEVGDKE